MYVREQIPPFPHRSHRLQLFVIFFTENYANLEQKLYLVQTIYKLGVLIYSVSY
jgi:hypothetical protein